MSLKSTPKNVFDWIQVFQLCGIFLLYFCLFLYLYLFIGHGFSRPCETSKEKTLSVWSVSFVNGKLPSKVGPLNILIEISLLFTIIYDLSLGGFTNWFNQNRSLSSEIDIFCTVGFNCLVFWSMVRIHYVMFENVGFSSIVWWSNLQASVFMSIQVNANKPCKTKFWPNHTP